MLITSKEFHACLWSTILGSVCYFFEKGMVCLKKAMAMLACHSATTGVKTFLSQSRVFFLGIEPGHTNWITRGIVIIIIVIA